MEFVKEKYKVFTWKNGLMLHWIINPGLAINELIFGQRVPKVSLEEIALDKPRHERGFVPCPYCNTIHDSRTWSPQNGTAFKNWFGLYCPSCGKIIPCLMNAFSFIILTITFPIWGWFKNNMKAKWLAKQPARYEDIDLNITPMPYDGNGWIKQGLIWGGMMFLIMTLGFPLFSGEEITLKNVILGIIIWTLGGLGFGYSMKRYMGKAMNKNA